MPSWVGRLPKQVGYPAGGSLSADEYKALFLVYLPLIVCFLLIYSFQISLINNYKVPIIWHEWRPLAQTEWIKAMEKWEANERAPEADHHEKPQIRMHSDDADNYLKLTASLSIILSRTIRTSDLTRAETLLKEYLTGYLSVSKTSLIHSLNPFIPSFFS